MDQSVRHSVRSRRLPAGLRSAVAPALAILGLALFMLAIAPRVRAEEQQPPAAPKPASCSAPEYRQFDFWVGEWDVWTEKIKAKGGQPARSSITLVEDGCVVQEIYTTSIGYSGRSLNYYDRSDGRWHQSWIDNGGSPILQVGGLQGESMVLDSPGPDGASDRITWTPMKDGRVRQHWSRSTDGGKTWGTVFDGMYHPRGK